MREWVREKLKSVLSFDVGSKEPSPSGQMVYSAVLRAAHLVISLNPATNACGHGLQIHVWRS